MFPSYLQKKLNKLSGKKLTTVSSKFKSNPERFKQKSSIKTVIDSKPLV